MHGEVDSNCGSDEFEEINRQYTLEIRGEGVMPCPPIRIKTANPMLISIGVNYMSWLSVSEIVNINPVSAGGTYDG